MATVRWGRSEFAEAPAVPKVRWGRSELTGTADASTKVRWGRSELSGTAVSSVKVRWGRSELAGTAAVILAPIPDQLAVEPETLLSFEARLQDGTIAGAYTWRRISGPVVTLTNISPHILTVRAPSNAVSTSRGPEPAPATLVLGVTATEGGLSSPERTVTVTVLTQTRWYYDAGTWRGKRPTVWLGEESVFGDEFPPTF